jgi:hypothetical protein
MDYFSPKYRTAIQESLKAFVENGHEVACVGYFVLELGSCQMCQHEPIKKHYVLENLQTHAVLVVGSRCVEYYQGVLSEWGYQPEHITFPTFMASFAKRILQNNPKAIVFNDGIVMRFQGQVAPIIDAVSRQSQIKEYRYFQRSIEDHTERVSWVDNAGSDVTVAMIRTCSVCGKKGTPESIFVREGKTYCDDHLEVQCHYCGRWAVKTELVTVVRPGYVGYFCPVCTE